MDNNFTKVAENITTSAEGAVKLASTLDPFVDQFARAALYKAPRKYEEIAVDQEVLYAIDPIMTIKLSLYFRIITRNVKDFGMHRGTGLKNESILRIKWLLVNHYNEMRPFLCLLPILGSWKDLFELKTLASEYQIPGEIFSLLDQGITNESTCELVKKYLPTIQSNPKTPRAKKRTELGKILAKRWFKTRPYEQYRKLKASGTAHQWQQAISKGKPIQWSTVAGKALNLLIHSKYLERHNLVTDYLKWLDSKDDVNCTNFVGEIFEDLSNEVLQQTANKQFNRLIKNLSADSNYLTVVDCSGSMQSKATGSNMSSLNLAYTIALYFSYTLKGHFANHYATFDHKCTLREFTGNTPVEKYQNASSHVAYGPTNLQSVAEMFGSTLRMGVPEADFPKGIILISDGEFARTNKAGEFIGFKENLKKVGFSEEYIENFKIILWDIPNGFYSLPRIQYEASADAPNIFYMSGLDPATLAFIFEDKVIERPAPKTAEELFEAAMQQPILQLVQ